MAQDCPFLFGQRAAMVIRLYYEELSDEASKNSRSNLKQFSEVPDLERRESNGRTNELLAKKAGVGKSSMAYLIAVYRNRLDLFERVFDGTMSINKAYTQMKSECLEAWYVGL